MSQAPTLPASEALINAVHRHSEAGLPILPLNGKRPIDDGWQLRDYSADDIIAKLCSVSDPMIGLRFGPGSCIDIEADSPEEECAFGELFEGCEVPVTPTYNSPRGKHRLYAWDDRLSATEAGVVNFRGGNGAKLGIRIGAGDKGAQSVLPPSGGRMWLISPDDCEFAPLPELTIERILAAARPKSTQAERNGHAATAGVNHPALNAMMRSTKSMQDGSDGSRRVYAMACRAVEFNLSDELATATIQAALSERPTPRTYSTTDILQRVRDAEGATRRGKALVVKRPRTDLGNAERFVDQHGDKVRSVPVWPGYWLCWDSSRFRPDTTGEVNRLGKSTVRNIYQEAATVDDADERKAISQWAIGSEKRERLSAMLALASTENPIAVDYNSLDAQPWLLGCKNGTVELRTGELRPADPGDLITKSTGVEYPTEPGVDPVLWLNFLDDIFSGNSELIGFVQRLFGSALVGEQVEHILAILHGNGANGKSVFTSTLQAAFGDYAMTAPPKLLTIKRGETHPTEQADLFRMRLVIVSETPDGARLDEGLVKSISGGDKIRARRMRENFWEFTPSHLPIIATNHKPVVRGTDYGIWRRLRLIPFNVTIPPERQDKHLAEKLRAELPAILRWLVCGCLEWQRSGLLEPPIVLAATEAYRDESDTFKNWLVDRCEVDPQIECRGGVAYHSYRDWCSEVGEDAISNVKFAEKVEITPEFRRDKRREGVFYGGFAPRNSV